MKIKELLKQIDDGAIDIQSALDEYAADEVSADTLLRAASQVENLFKEIRTYGVCRGDIETLNALGLTNVESMYYNETRSMVGLKAALEADSEGGWVSLVIGGILVAMAAVLSFFVGKLLGWLLGSSGAMDKASSASASKSVVKIDKGRPDVGIPLKELGGKTGVSDAVAIGRLGVEYVDGGVASKLIKAAEDGLAGIHKAVAEYGADVLTMGDISAYLKAAAATEYAALENNKSPTKQQIDAVLDKLNTSKTMIQLVTDTYPTILAMVGPRIEDYKAKAADGKPILAANTISAKSQQVINLDTSVGFFSSALVSGERFNISLDMNSVDFTILNKAKSGLESEIKQLETSGRNVKQKGGTSGTRNEKMLIKRVINIEITYPTQYCISLIRTAITKLLTAMLHYKNAQARLNVRWGGMFYQSQIDKVRKLIKDVKPDKAVAEVLEAKLATLKDSDVKDAFDILAEVWDKLHVIDQHKTKQSATDIKFFSEYVNINPQRGDGLMLIMASRVLE